MPRKLAIAFTLFAGLALTLSFAVVGAFIPQPTAFNGYMVIPGRNDWATEGTVCVTHSSAGLRHDLFIDPGPYTESERIRILSPIRAKDIRPSPGWIRSIALNHAGPTFGGWQARVAAFGWPRPVLYWLWDWRTETLSGGAVPTSIQPPAATSIQVPEHALPWRFIWSGLFIDWGIYSGGTLLIAFVYIRLRALNRRRRGQCPTCGYNRRGLGPRTLCPECGTGFPTPPGNPPEPTASS